MADVDAYRLALEAERLLADPTLKMACERLEQKQVASWKLATTTQQRETCHATVKAADGLMAELRIMADVKAKTDAEDKRYGRNPKR